MGDLDLKLGGLPAQVVAQPVVDSFRKTRCYGVLFRSANHFDGQDLVHQGRYFVNDSWVILLVQHPFLTA